MTSTLGIYYSAHHWRGEDADYFRRLDPAWARIHQPSARAIYIVQLAAPNANVMLRSWDIDDDNGNRKRELYDDPKGAARKHLDMWGAKLASLRKELAVNEWQVDQSKWYLGLVNEPDPNFLPQVVEYTLEAMKIAKEYGWHLGVVVSSVGTFSKPSEGGNSWDLCKPLEKPINDGGHILVVHEYWQPEGPNYGEDGGNLAWRHRHIPLNVPILIGESGANGYIYSRYSKEDNAGWGKFMNAEQYAAQVKEYIEGCDTRVKGVLLYMTDYHSDQWKAFDTYAAHEALLAIKDTKPLAPNPFANKPTTQYLPTIGNGPTPPVTVVPRTGEVITRKPSNIRNAPTFESGILEVAPIGTRLTVTGMAGDFYEVARGTGLAYVHDSVVSAVGAQVMPEPTHSTDWLVTTLARVLGVEVALAKALLQVESGGHAFDSNGRLVIRIELHQFRKYLNNDALFDTHFYHDPNRGHLDQKWRRSRQDVWKPAHIGTPDFDVNQDNEWEVFNLAASFNRTAAYLSSSLGAAQIMGFNHAMVGYSTPEAMFVDYAASELAQVAGLFAYCHNKPGMIDAMRRKDFVKMGALYNGDGAHYGPILAAAYNKIKAGK